jgi:hypothetical protein
MKKYYLVFITLFLCIVFPNNVFPQPAIHFHLSCTPNDVCKELSSIWGEGKTLEVQQNPALTIYRENIVDIELNENSADFHVVVQLDKTSAEVLHRITEEHTGKRLSIVFDDLIYSSPRIQAPIPNGKFFFRYDKNYKVFSKIGEEMGITEFIQQKKAFERKQRERAYYFYMSFTILFTLCVAAYILFPYFRKRSVVTEGKDEEQYDE